MKSCLRILTLILFLLIQYQSIAQAYDGGIDRKAIIGYTHVGDNSGMELKYDCGLSDLLSVGVGYTYLFFDTPVPADTQDKYTYFVEKSDFGLFLNFHLFQKQINTPEIDVYAGPDVTFKSLGIHAGVKYNFSERIGVYFQALQSFSNSLYGVGDSSIGTTNLFGKQFAISTGFTINLS
jgi:hypothetical protein